MQAFITNFNEEKRKINSGMQILRFVKFVFSQQKKVA